jgi:sulfopyruvate decarboxylase subunit alpha
MLDGPGVVQALKACGVTHVVWLPDTELGRWDQALASAPGIQLVRVCREGEAFSIAAGLHLGGKRPIVIIQCTGLFEAGDSLRNVLFDLDLPLFVVVGRGAGRRPSAGRPATPARASSKRICGPGD